MGKKYIIEMEDNESVYKTIISNGYPMIQVIVPTPYTEPDLEQVRKESFEKGYSTAVAEQECAVREAAEKGYQKGLSDAWEAAKNVYLPEDHGGLGYKMRRKVFDTDNIGWIFKNLSASGAIGKIHAFEEKKKEEQEIKVGDWVQNGGVIGVVTYIEQTNDGICYHVLGEDGHLWYLDDTVTKKYEGRVPKEIAGFLKKMRADE